MDDITNGMDESENILKSLNDELKVNEEKKDTKKEGEINENDAEEKDDEGETEDKKDISPDLNKFVDQVSVSVSDCKAGNLWTIKIPREILA